MPDIISIGEALIDFLSLDRGITIEETRGFTIAPGGAPANVAAACAKLGGSSGFIGKVGNDSFGRMIKNALGSVGVNIDQLILDNAVNTTLAFISVKANGEPDFTFYRNHCGADVALKPDELDEGYIYDGKILHFGSISFTCEPLKGSTIKAIEIARGSNKVLSFDPNLRPSLWDNLHRAKIEIEKGFGYADVVKMTEEELEFITGTKSLSEGTDLIIKYGPRIVIITRGSNSCYFNNGIVDLEVPTYNVEAIDTTGAGDAFVAGVLLTLLERSKAGSAVFNMERYEAEDMLRFAHACGAITVTRKGVIPALPTMDEVQEFLKKH